MVICSINCKNHILPVEQYCLSIGRMCAFYWRRQDTKNHRNPVSGCLFIEDVTGVGTAVPFRLQFCLARYAAEPFDNRPAVWTASVPAAPADSASRSGIMDKGMPGPPYNLLMDVFSWTLSPSMAHGTPARHKSVLGGRFSWDGHHAHAVAADASALTYDKFPGQVL